MTVRVRALCLLVAHMLLAARALVAADNALTDSSEAAEELKALRDQTIVRSGVWIDTEWDQFDGGAEKAKWTLAGLWGWHVRERQDAGLRLKLPFVYNRSDASSGQQDTGGVGDIEIGAGTAFLLNDKWRTAAGVELHADTASNPALGDSMWRLKPAWGVAHDFTKWLTVTFNAEYNYSIAEEHNAPPQRYGELSLPATFILPYDWALSP
ncbi:MAG TPA: transporter, partial [Candidatus Udaeobacter sp.]|nr:transporter [Candidatus Udaeobacter sp.]